MLYCATLRLVCDKKGTLVATSEGNGLSRKMGRSKILIETRTRLNVMNVFIFVIPLENEGTLLNHYALFACAMGAEFTDGSTLHNVKVGADGFSHMVSMSDVQQVTPYETFSFDEGIYVDHASARVFIWRIGKSLWLDPSKKQERIITNN